MIRFFLRFLGFLFLAGGFVALVLDGARTIAADRLRVTPLQETWIDWHSASFQQVQPAIERAVAPWVWDPVILSLLAAPTCLVLGVLGALLLLAGRKRRAPIGYAR